MADINLWPAILMAGPPHSGKSVLTYQLSKALRAQKVAHITLLAVPDGEGDWFQETETALRFQLRGDHKRGFTPALVAGMRRAIEARRLPFLVDIGGRPQGEQFTLLEGCTHVIQLYREELDRDQWRTWLADRNLIQVAELQSVLHGRDKIESDTGVLRGTISGLDREHPALGLLFERLGERVRGVFDYSSATVLERHAALCPDNAQFITVEALGRTADIAAHGQELWWQPEDLRALSGALPTAANLALYGRGPVWLYGMVGAQIAPAICYVFDARHFGWIRPPQVHLDSHHPNTDLEFSIQAADGYSRLCVKYDVPVLTPQPLYLPPLPVDHGVILDGKLPNWLWVALTRALRHHPWIAIYEPRQNRAVNVWGNNVWGKLGELIPLPPQL